MTDLIGVEQITGHGFSQHIDRLAVLLNACVNGGASVGFITPHTTADSRAYWEKAVRPGVTSGSKLLFIAIADHVIAGTVQLDISMFPNQRHRAEVGKLLVDPGFRRRGIGCLLMNTLEQKAHELGRRLLTLDTITGSPAESLYRTLGFMPAGEIPDYARDPLEDRLDPTLFMYKSLKHHT